MSPAIVVLLKCIAIGIGGLLASLAVASVDNAVTMGELVAAVSGGWALALGYAGLGYVTPLEAIGK